MGAINTASIFLVNTIFELYVYIIILRLVLPLIRADFNNPVSQLAINLTNPVLSPLKRYIPNIGAINLSVILFLFLVDGLKLFLIVFMQYHTLPNFIGLFIWVVGDILDQATSLMFMAIIIVAILSWVASNVVNPIALLLHQLTNPYLSIFRKYIPPMAGIDFSPIAALICLKIATILICYPIKELGSSYIL